MEDRRRLAVEELARALGFAVTVEFDAAGGFLVLDLAGAGMEVRVLRRAEGLTGEGTAAGEAEDRLRAAMTCGAWRGAEEMLVGMAEGERELRRLPERIGAGGRSYRAKGQLCQSSEQLEGLTDCEEPGREMVREEAAARSSAGGL